MEGIDAGGAMAGVLDWGLVFGPVPTTITVLGGIAGLSLLIGRDRRWWVRSVPLALAAGMAATLLIWWVVDGLWQPFPDPLPARVLVWIGVGCFGIALAVATMRRHKWLGRIGAILAALLVVLTATVKVNAYFGHFPTLRGMLGLPYANEIAFDSLDNVDKPVTAELGRPLIDAWTPPADLPAAGKVTQVAIPATRSKFSPTRNAYVYLPPAYLTAHRPLLPVLVMLHGQPGQPADWLNGGKIAEVMDTYAAAHKGLAPVVVMPDATGSLMGNPLCLDSKLGASESYLAGDVPDWIRSTLQVDQDTTRWAVGGFSYGGTCALQLALRRPDVFRTFIDISGQEEPTLGTRAQTVAEAFGGDAAAFSAVNPLDLLQKNKYPDSAGTIAVGRSDTVYLPQQRKVYDALRHNGMDVTLREVDGTHTWPAWSAGLVQSLDWLAKRMGVIAR